MGRGRIRGQGAALAPNQDGEGLWGRAGPNMAASTTIYQLGQVPSASLLLFTALAQNASRVPQECCF